MRKTIHSLITCMYFLFCSIACFSQSDTGYYYFDDNFARSADTAAINAGLALRQPDSSWRLTVVNKLTRKVTMTGNYLENYLQKEEGLFEYFFPNGILRQQGYYHQGIQVGLWKGWMENGKLFDSIFFDNGKAMMTAHYNYNNDGNISSYSYRDVASKTIIDINYNSDGSISSENRFTGKAGIAKQYYPSGKLSYSIEFDNNGARKRPQYFREDGTEISEKEHKKELNELANTIKAAQPEFTGGYHSFQAFVQRSLKLPDSFRNIYHDLEWIRFSFMLDANGFAQNLKLISPQDTELEKALMNMLRTMPAWDMKGLKSYGPITQTIEIKLVDKL